MKSNRTLAPLRRIAGLALVALVTAPAARADFDIATWSALLRDHTTETNDVVGTRVDYRGLAADPRWEALVADLEAARPSRLASRDEQLAFWINAYNVLAIRMVIRHYPLESIRDAGSFFRPVWKHEIARIEGEAITLDAIEHDILRPMGEPRIHAAIVCASTSCPSLARTPYTADGLDAELDATMRRWLADPRKGLRIDRAREEVTLSRIFDWFEQDFRGSGGAVRFAARFAPEADREWLERNADRVDVEHFDYDWTLNEWRR